MKTELDKMVADEIFLLAVPKKAGSVCICLDPKDLNTAIKHSHYPLPSLQDVISRLTNAKVF